MDSCYDVLVLHTQFAQNTVSVEEIFDVGAAGTVLFRCSVLPYQYGEYASRGDLEALRWTRSAGLRNDKSVCTFYALLPKSIPKEEGGKEKSIFQ